MSVDDQDLFGTMIKVENKDIFVDLRKNTNGVYLKLSERNGKSRNTVLIPASGISRLKTVLEEVSSISTKYVKSSGPERKNRVVENPEVVSRSVYVSGLAWTTTSDAVTNHFSQAGKVVKSVVLQKTRGGKNISLGCGVVEFRTVQEAVNAINTLNETELDGRTIKCREDRDGGASSSERSGGTSNMAVTPVATVGGTAPVTKRPTGNNNKPTTIRSNDSERVMEPTKVFVTSLPWKTTSKDLMLIFSEVGDVVSAEVLSTKKGRSLGHAVLTFTDAASAAQAIVRINGQELEGRTLVVREYYQN